MPALRTLVVGDSVEPWEQLGFNVINGTIRLGRVTIVLGGREATEGITGWSIAGVDSDVDGLATVSVPTLVPANRLEPHHNGVFGVDRLTIHTDDVDRSAMAFESVGIQQREPEVFWAGRSIIELRAPSPSAIEASGRATFGRLTVVCDDFDRTAGVLDSLLAPRRDAAQTGRVVSTLNTTEAGVSVPIDIISPHPNAGIEHIAAEARTTR